VAFKTGSIVKLHVHTMTPDKVLARCLEYGEFISVKIENMSLQHSSNTIAEEEAEENVTVRVSEEAENEIRKRYGVVAVTNGPGIEALFRELGTDEIVQGGQTQNPSTNDFLDAFEKVHAEHIFVFPNNGNILMAAQQAAELYEKAEIHVIPSKNIGTGYVALSTINFEDPDPQSIIDEMTEAMKRVTAGFVSPSIRDAEINGVNIKKGDTIGVIEKEIVVSESDKMNAVYSLAVQMLKNFNKFMLSIFCGRDTDEAEQEKIRKYIEENCPGTEVYFIDGGQEIYPYIIVAE